VKRQKQISNSNTSANNMLPEIGRYRPQLPIK